MNKRQYPRFPFKEPVDYQMKEDGAGAGALADDISRGGVRIRVQKFLPLGSILQLKIHMSQPVRVFQVKGRVVWVRELPHSDCYDIGIKFLEVLPI